MNDIAIRVENLSKQYRIGGPQARYKTIRESLTEAVQAPFRRLSSVVRGQSSAVANETIWALKDVSFEVKRGEVMGIIGRNGAGKTTLLKILSRITEPTEGYAEIHGRVGSLLEVGTGFHPELTGRENIYLNGAILGMKRAEIERKFDEMVAFAEIEKFMDTPVKHYSSGMYVRLAFAVAAHMEPEILLVDEVLAVGDIAFQKKCLGKMSHVAQEGRTVLFVSHNLAAVERLCQTGIVLEEGEVVTRASMDEAIERYTRLLQRDTDEMVRASRKIAVRNFHVFGDGDGIVAPSRESAVEFTLQIQEPLSNLLVLLLVRDSEQSLIIRDEMNPGDFSELSRQGTFVVKVSLPPLWLRPGLYTYYVKVIGDAPGVTERCVSDPITVSVAKPSVGGYVRQGLLAPRTVWTVRSRDSYNYMRKAWDAR